MKYPKADCDGDCFHCPLPDCQSGNYPPYRPTPFEREQIAIRRDKARRARRRPNTACKSSGRSAPGDDATGLEDTEQEDGTNHEIP